MPKTADAPASFGPCWLRDAGRGMAFVCPASGVQRERAALRVAIETVTRDGAANGDLQY